MNVVEYITDGLRNLVSGLGTSRDKAAGSSYYEDRRSDYEIMNAYRYAWLPPKIVDIPANDAFRAWRNWQADSDQVEKIEEEEKRLNVRGKFIEALKLARLTGGAAIVFGDGTDNEEPINPEKIRAGGIQYLTVLNKYELTPGEKDLQFGSPNYKKPLHYTLSTSEGGNPRIHPSRLIIFHGTETPDSPVALNVDGWGDSVLQRVFSAVRDLDSSTSNAASLIFESKVDIIRIPDLTKKLSAGGDAEKKLTERFQLAATMKGNNGTLILDKEEEYDSKSTSFSGLPQVLDKLMTVVSGSCDIAATRLFGKSPDGLNASGDGDTRNYYDNISAMQTLVIDPAINVFNECLIRSALGSRPPEIYYEWVPLWQVSAKEKAEIGRIIVETFEKMAGILPEDAIAESLVATLVQSGAAPGIESAMDKYAELAEEEARMIEESENADPDNNEDLNSE